MAKKTPTVTDKNFILWDYDTNQEIISLDITNVTDWQYWQEWLDRPDTKSFRYIRADSVTCSIIKEQRPQFGAKNKLAPTWYGHKRIGGRLRRRYLGKSENLNYERLKQVAFELAQLELF